MKTPLAWLNLLHNKIRTMIAVAGVAFAVVLVFMQIGFLGAVETTATIVYGAIDFDIMIRSKEYLHISDTRAFSRDYLYVAESVPGVRKVSPFYVAQTLWRNPKSGLSRGILVLGFDPADDVFLLPDVTAQQKRLTAPRFLLIDRASRREFGPLNDRQYGDQDIGSETSLTGERVRIVGHFRLGGGLANDGTVITSDRGFARVAPGRTINDVSFGLVKVKDGADREAVRRRIERALSAEQGDVEVLTREDVLNREIQRWVWETSIGIIFIVGVVLAMFVGTAIVYQVLSTDVANHIAEYATLKAMGYSDSFLAGVVMVQAVTLAVIGFVPGLIISEVLYRFTAYMANLPIGMNLVRIATVFGLAVAMCVISGLGALRKVRSLDPADLF